MIVFIRVSRVSVSYDDIHVGIYEKKMTIHFQNKLPRSAYMPFFFA